MKFAIVDDTERDINLLRQYITEQLGDSCEFFCYHSGEEFLSAWKCGDYDLIILDIYMDKLLGIDVAKKIRESDKDVRLAFCTTSNEFAGESYELDASFYLRKPFSEEQVKNMLDRLKLDEVEILRSVTMPDGQRIIFRSVTYAEYLGRNIIIHSKKGENISVRILFSEVEKIFLKYTYFCTCSKGVIVNFHEVKAIKDNCFIMKSSDKVPISRRKIKEVSEAYAAFRFENLRKDSE